MRPSPFILRGASLGITLPFLPVSASAIDPPMTAPRRLSIGRARRVGRSGPLERPRRQGFLSWNEQRIFQLLTEGPQPLFVA